MGVGTRLVFGSELVDPLRSIPQKCGWSFDERFLVSDMLAKVDVDDPRASPHLYVAGFPCTNESVQGEMTFVNLQLNKCLATIEELLPLSFVMENVLGFNRGRQRRRRFAKILRRLRKL